MFVEWGDDYHRVSIFPMDDRYTPREPAFDEFSLLDEMPAAVVLLIVALGVAAPLLAAFLLAA